MPQLNEERALLLSPSRNSFWVPACIGVWCVLGSLLYVRTLPVATVIVSLIGLLIIGFALSRWSKKSGVEVGPGGVVLHDQAGSPQVAWSDIVAITPQSLDVGGNSLRVVGVTVSTQALESETFTPAKDPRFDFCIPESLCGDADAFSVELSNYQRRQLFRAPPNQQ